MTGGNRVYRWFRLVWKGSGAVMAAIIVLSILVAGSQVAFPWIWQHLVDEMRAGAGPARLEELAFWMLIIGLVHFVFYSLIQSARTMMNARIQWRARRRVFNHLTHLGSDFYREWRTGDLVTRLSDDAGNKLSWFLCSGVFRAFEASMIVLACLAAMSYIDIGLTLWVVLPLPLLILGQALAQGTLGRRYRSVQQAISGINDELASTFSGIRIVQACHLQDAARTRFVERSEAQKIAEVKTAVVRQAIGLMYGYGWQATVVALLIAGGMKVMDGSITLGQYVTFEGLVMALVWPMFDFGTFVSRYKETDVAIERLETIMNAAEDADRGGKAPVVATDVAIDKGVISDGEQVLMPDIDLQVRTGELVAVVGAVASGKSLLMGVLAGIRLLSHGQLRVGGVPWEELNRSARREAIGFVPQDPVILSTTLRDNISLGRDIGEAAFDDAVRVSQLHNDMDAFPAGFDTQIGERGVTLSGGQQQRLALARALAGRPSILLLDDATAALDADTETAFWTQLESVLPQTAALVVTHRAATIRRADRIIVLDKCRIAQVGVHDDLIEEIGPYRRIYGMYETADGSWSGQFRV